MQKIAVIADGTAAHEEGVYVTTAKDETDALNQAGDYIIAEHKKMQPELDEFTLVKGKIENHCSPTYEMDILDSNGDTVLSMHTAPVEIIS
jgi:hypothetical protein